VRNDSIGHRCAPVDRRPDERVPEGDGAGGQQNQLHALRWLKIPEPDADSLHGVDHNAKFTGGLRGGHQQREPCTCGQPFHPGAERVQHTTTGAGQCGSDGRSTADGIARTQCRGKFDERQRVSAGFLDQPVTLVRSRSAACSASSAAAAD
jgi:hypothetical protein